MEAVGGASVRQCVSASVRQCVSASVRQCVSASVRQCVSASVRQCVSASVRQCVSASICELSHEPGGFAMRSHGSAEWSEDYPWKVNKVLLPRSGRPMAAKV